jgi:hypothetical protein
VRAAALDAVAAFPALLADREVRLRIGRALADPDVTARIAAIRLALDHKGLVTDRALLKALADEAPAHRIALLTAIETDKSYAADLRLIGVLSDALVDEDSGVREKAVQVLQTHPGLVANPSVAEGLRELSRADNPRQAEIAAALLKSRGRTSGGAAGTDGLDRRTSRPGCCRSSTPWATTARTAWAATARTRSCAWSRPVGTAAGRRRPRGPTTARRCGSLTWPAPPTASCWASPPGTPTRRPRPRATRPRRPTPAGVRFEPRTSPEYQTILDWINGARLKPEGEPAASR